MIQEFRADGIGLESGELFTERNEHAPRSIGDYVDHFGEELSVPILYEPR